MIDRAPNGTGLLPQEIIRRKRDGEALTAEVIEDLVDMTVDGSISDEQLSAFAMAVFFQGMNAAEQSALTRAMAASGVTIDWKVEGVDGPIVDKHSTGGVGDKVSLIIAPLAAACGAFVPMISGRGLGHTGGTLDKLESIPGYDATPGLKKFVDITRDVGCSIIGQTDDLAPADRRLYAIRDVTATVETIPLITASILSKKLAAGLDGLALDVKAGSGAFMRDVDSARALAQNLVRVAGEAGLPASALVTDMNQILGRAAGNAVEVREAINLMKGDEVEPRLRDCTLALAAEMLLLGGISDSREEALDSAEAALSSGRAAEIFGRMVAAHGGPSDLLDRPGNYLKVAVRSIPVSPEAAGTVAAVDVREVGLAVTVLGGGRTDPKQTVDPAVGLTEIAGIGEEVGSDRPLAIIHASDEQTGERAAARIRRAFITGHKAVTPNNILLERVGAD